jgi:hypothetical protein
MMMNLAPSSYMVMTLTDCKAGNGIKVRFIQFGFSEPLRALVFAKEEIVFARTSPKHKLEIGSFLYSFL